MNYDAATKEELLELAQARDIAGRSDMSKAELVQAHMRWELNPQMPELTRAPYTALTLAILRRASEAAEAAAQRAEAAAARAEAAADRAEAALADLQRPPV